MKAYQEFGECAAEREPSGQRVSAEENDPNHHENKEIRGKPDTGTAGKLARPPRAKATVAPGSEAPSGLHGHPASTITTALGPPLQLR